MVNRLLSGAVVIEAVFAIPGVGSMVAYSAINKDFPVVQGVVLVLVMIVIVINLLIDVLYTVLDPRVAQAMSGETIATRFTPDALRRGPGADARRVLALPGCCCSRCRSSARRRSRRYSPIDQNVNNTAACSPDASHLAGHRRSRPRRALAA